MSKEQAIQQTDSFEIFRFVAGSAEYLYTSFATDVAVDGETYQAVPIQRGELVTDMVQGMISCMVQAPVTSEFVRFVIGMPYLSTSVTIRKYFADDTTTGALLFTGKVNSISVSKNVANVECASSMNELNRKIPRVFIQSFCNNALYGDTCGIVLAAWARNVNNVTVNPADNTVIASVGLTGFAADWFSHGIAAYGDERRYISKHDAATGTIILHFPFLGLQTGNNIICYPGCDKDPEMCRDKFNNLNNFVGMPYMSHSPNPTIYGVD